MVLVGSAHQHHLPKDGQNPPGDSTRHRFPNNKSTASTDQGAKDLYQKPGKAGHDVDLLTDEAELRVVSITFKGCLAPLLQKELLLNLCLG